MEEENQSKENTLNDYKEGKNDELFTNIFSNIGNFEKDKQYQQLQKDLYSLQQNVDLMEEFANKDKLSDKRKLFLNKINILNIDKDNNYKKNYSKIRNSVIMRKKKNMINDSNNNSTNNITVPQNDNNIKKILYKNIDKKNKEKNIININKKKILNQLKNKINNKLIYQTEVNNYNQYINGEKLPNIYLSPDKINESNLGSKNTNNTNTNSSSKLPLIKDRNLNKSVSPKRLYILTDNEINNNNISINENNNNNKNIMYRKIPLIKKNLRDNSIVRKFPSILNSHRENRYSLNHRELVPNTDKIVRKMKEKNVNIRKKINYKIHEHNLIDWQMKSKLKLVQWKYGIAEVQKYFIDLQAYGKPEESELIKRKTFYDYVDDVIDEIKKAKEEKEIKSIEDKYIKKNDNNKFGNIKKNNDEKKNEDNEFNEVDNTVNKQIELNGILEKVKLRKIKEKEKRDLIDKILFKCDIRSKAINDSTNKINYKKKILNKSKESDKNDKSLKSIENENNDKSKNDINNDKDKTNEKK